jgi:hypothetical protein
MAIPQMVAKCHGVNSLYVDCRECAGIGKMRKQSDAVESQERFEPVVSKVAKPGRFQVGPDGSMEGDRLGEREDAGRRLRSNVFEFTDVPGRCPIARHERPDVRDSLSRNEQHSRALRAHEPLVKTRREEAAGEVCTGESEVSESLCSVDENRRPAAVSYVCKCSHR